MDNLTQQQLDILQYVYQQSLSKGIVIKGKLVGFPEIGRNIILEHLSEEQLEKAKDIIYLCNQGYLDSDGIKNPLPTGSGTAYVFMVSISKKGIEAIGL